MKRMNMLAALSVVTLLAATTAWAGGNACSGNESEASAKASGKACPISGTTSASMSANGGHCDLADGKACTIGANAMVYTFAVPGAECDHCAESISKALMAEKGVQCAHVDLKTHVAYVVSDKKLDKNAISKSIKTAGFKNSYRNDGKAARADLMKYMTAATAKPDACCAAKPKEKV
ncbi:MAG TPA: heavy metal-associated domain-containing protein [Candidatus Eisenbacteria bacterium]|nr:heavy metal-associated domain-containing protein [Candidatus Eisenbacteria bacterium]